MPGFEWEIVVAEEEGIQMCPGRTFKEVVLEGGHIVGVRCVEVDFRGFKDGRPDMDEIPDTEHILPADLVIWAIGQGADLSFLPKGDRIRRREPAGIQSDAEMMTSMPGVFVAGDVHRGVTFFVVDAIGEGHKVARSIDRYLRDGVGLGEPVLPEKVAYSKKEIEAKFSQASQQNRIQIANIPLEDRAGNFNEVDLTITEEQAIIEAQRCLICGPCSECLACVEACKAGAIAHDQQETSAHLNVGAIIYADMRIARKCAGCPLCGARRSLVRLGSRSRCPGQHWGTNRTRSKCQLFQRGNKTPCELAPSFVNAVTTFQASSIPKRSEVKSSTLSDVVHTQILPFSCSQEAAEFIQAAVDTHQLDRAVLAACSCCSVDQACYSCTYQRLRSRQNLGVLPGSDGHFPAWTLSDLNLSIFANNVHGFTLMTRRRPQPRRLPLQRQRFPGSEEKRSGRKF